MNLEDNWINFVIYLFINFLKTIIDWFLQPSQVNQLNKNLFLLNLFKNYSLRHELNFAVVISYFDFYFYKNFYLHENFHLHENFRISNNYYVSMYLYIFENSHCYWMDFDCFKLTFCNLIIRNSFYFYYLIILKH